MDNELITEAKASASPFAVSGLNDASTYSSDLKLFKDLGLEPFKNIAAGAEYFVGEVKFENGSWVKIWVYPMPALFWKFEIYDAESKKSTIATTGSGALINFWPSVKLIAENMFVIDTISSNN